MTKRIVLCADDYGQASFISLGIINLIKQSRLSATSCIVTMDHWKEQAEWLKPYQSQVDIGLHFNLTEGSPLTNKYKNKYGSTFDSLAKLMVKALTQLDSDVIAAECEAQVLRFHEALGFFPNFIDGHQHVHQFPIIRNAVIATFERYLDPHSTYIRIAEETPSYHPKEFFLNLKKLIINNMGAKALKQILMDKNIQYNQSFAGIYQFNHASQYRAYFQGFLKDIKDKGIIMCHPGNAESKPSDTMTKARSAEYSYFAGEHFLEDCRRYDVSLSRFF